MIHHEHLHDAVTAIAERDGEAGVALRELLSTSRLAALP
jgi:hypothetical protein